MPLRLVEVILVAIGGAAGCMARYAVGELVAAGKGFSSALSSTMLCNITGCLAIGIIAALFRHFEAGHWLYLLVITGLLGGYTTYSAFALDTVRHLEAGNIAAAAVYVTVTLAGAVAACVASYFATTAILKAL